MKKSNFVLVGMVIGMQGAPALANKIYVARGGTNGVIERVNLDGSGLETLVNGAVEEFKDISLDLAGGKMYFTYSVVGGPNNNRIRRANLDGTGVEDLIFAGAQIPNRITVSGGKMYWTQSPGIRRANLDGSGEETIITDADGFYGIEVIESLNKVYWISGPGLDTAIRRANLDGTNVETVVTVPSELPFGDLAVSALGKVYWSALILAGGNSLRSANLDGSGVALLTTTTNPIFCIDVDEDAGKLYWTNLGSGSGLQRANLDGSGIQNVLAGSDNNPFTSLTLDFESLGNAPAVSTWGVVCLGLLMASAGTLLLRRRNLALSVAA